ncbi:hypothetical protein Pcinc_035945 [Petrolisthes cinctipes]|uniref:Uncharacterized protein n=1 Tax=Petrolisthes cinctipes TaxID=88211 RepID=A0AAE1BYQ8_PETCI|nr:hypothetical protein Pcinc_035945 [Petrolisthes cinctipes]
MQRLPLSNHRIPASHYNPYTHIKHNHSLLQSQNPSQPLQSLFPHQAQSLSFLSKTTSPSFNHRVPASHYNPYSHIKNNHSLLQPQNLSQPLQSLSPHQAQTVPLSITESQPVTTTPIPTSNTTTLSFHQEQPLPPSTTES